MDDYAANFDAALNAAKRRGITAKVAGAATGLKSGEAMVSQWRRGERPIPANQALVMAELLNVLPESISAAYQRVARSQQEFARAAGGDNVVSIRHRASGDTAPTGAFASFKLAPSHRQPDAPGSIELPSQFLADQPVLLSPGIEVAVNQGNAMKGEIDAGSIVFIDTNVTDVPTDGVYAFVWVGRPMIKRIQIIASDGVRLRGTDKLDSIDVYGKERDALEIIGQVKGVLSLRSI